MGIDDLKLVDESSVLLDGLGSSAEEIRSNLAIMNISGDKINPTASPIAKFLVMQMPKVVENNPDSIIIFPDSVSVFPSPISVKCLRILFNDPMIEFCNKFCMGEFHELVG